MIATLKFLHWMAGLIILAEALNKLDRTPLLECGLSHHARLLAVLKALAWGVLAFGAGVALLAPLLLELGWPAGYYRTWLQLERPTGTGAAVMVGVALLIVRTRVKEG